MLSPKSLQSLLYGLSVLFCPVIASATGSSISNELNLKGTSAVGLSVTKEPFGKMPDGTEVERVLSNRFFSFTIKQTGFFKFELDGEFFTGMK
jgi:hypothetical protein